MNLGPKEKFNLPLSAIVIEDNQVDKKMMESMLQDPATNISNYKIVDSVKLAVKLIEENNFDIAVLDLNLPDSKGLETLKTINKMFPELAIVVNTGAYEDELGMETLSLGAQDFLVKGKYNAYVLNKVLHFCLERKRLETELVKACNELKEAQFHLIQTEKMKVVGGLASGVAHEVKNPLATILYGITYLDENLKETDDKVKSVLKNIKEAITRANDIITDLLNFSSLTKLNKQQDDINRIIEKSLSLVSYEINKNRVEINKKFNNDLSKIEIDINRIEQVLINLILNAIHAEGNEKNITIITEEVILSSQLITKYKLDKNKFTPEEKVIFVHIDDAGFGISEEDIDKIFDPFFTSRRASGGVGLGLSVSRNIIKMHEGDICIDNKSEGGVRATLIFKVI